MFKLLREIRHIKEMKEEIEDLKMEIKLLKMDMTIHIGNIDVYSMLSGFDDARPKISTKEAIKLLLEHNNLEFEVKPAQNSSVSLKKINGIVKIKRK